MAASCSCRKRHLQELLQCTDCVPMWLVRTKPFAPAEMRGTAERRFRFDMFVRGIHSCHSFLEFQASTAWQKQLPDSGSTLHLVASCPSLLCSCRKDLSYAEKQRVWSWSCGLQDLLQCSDCALSCAMRLLQTVNNYRDWAFSSSGLEVGLPALQLPMLAKWDALPKGDLGLTCLFKESIPAIPFGNSKHPLPGRSKFLRAAARSASSALGLQKIPSLRCSCRKRLCYAEKQRAWSRSCGPKNCCNIVIVLSVVLWDCCKPVNHCRDWYFSNSELDVWLPAFQLPMFAKCDALPKRNLFEESIPAIPFWNSKHPLPGRSNFLTAAARSTLFALGLQKNPPSSFLYKMGGVVRKIKWISTWFWG